MTNCILSCLADFNVTFEDITKIIELILLLVGCIIAGMGLKTWREQVIETPKIEFAREMVEQFYKMQNLVKRVRYPEIVCYPEAIKDYYKNDTWSDSQCACMARAKIIDEEINDIRNFQKMASKAKAYFSKDIENCFYEFNYIINWLPHAIKDMTEILGRKDFEQIKNEPLVLYLLDSISEAQENDETNKKMEEIIKEVECNLQPIYAHRIIKWKNLSPKKEQENDK